MLELLPHLNASFNAAITVLIIGAFGAIRRGKRELHPKLMKTAIVFGALFLIFYVVQFTLLGHRRFPGDDWVRTVFLVILTTHTILAVVVVPLVLRTFFLATRGRFSEHRHLARITFPIWLYVAITGLVVYAMNNHLRPPL